MGAVDDRDGALLRLLALDGEQVIAREQVEIGRDLVEEEHLGFVHECTSEGDAFAAHASLCKHQPRAHQS